MSDTAQNIVQSSSLCQAARGREVRADARRTCPPKTTCGSIVRCVLQSRKAPQNESFILSYGNKCDLISALQSLRQIVPAYKGQLHALPMPELAYEHKLLASKLSTSKLDETGLQNLMKQPSDLLFVTSRRIILLEKLTMKLRPQEVGLIPFLRDASTLELAVERDLQKSYSTEIARKTHSPRVL